MRAGTPFVGKSEDAVAFIVKRKAVAGRSCDVLLRPGVAGSLLHVSLCQHILEGYTCARHIQVPHLSIVAFGKVGADECVAVGVLSQVLAVVADDAVIAGIEC